LQDRCAKIKANNGIFVFTLGKETVQPKFVNRLEEAVDCIIELDVFEERGSSSRKLRVKKLAGQKHLEEWITFSIEPNRGIAFQVKKAK
jgi:archaellum biogenesis ATPase FlaH